MLDGTLGHYAEDCSAVCTSNPRAASKHMAHAVPERAAINAAPRLTELVLDPDTARSYHAILIQQVVRMLCAGIVHGDLSEHNILVDAHGPVIIDLPQAIDASANNNASRLLERDVANLADYFGQFAPELLKTNFGKEIWSLYEKAELKQDSVLTGRFKSSEKIANVREVMQVIEAAKDEDKERRERKALRDIQGH